MSDPRLGEDPDIPTRRPSTPAAGSPRSTTSRSAPRPTSSPEDAPSPGLPEAEPPSSG